MTSDATLAQHDDTPDAPSLLEVTIRHIGRVCVVALRGELCVGSLDAMESQIDRLGRTPCHQVVLDMSALKRVDVAGCRVLTGLYHYISGRRGHLTVVGASFSVRTSLATSPLITG